ncbi:hypothetical protein CEXT_91411 [Caerostris extrusa]|uniref:Uncharacterized protein n=1 Tax=Caerostris extrusa TaxID=172846 RepID=A0AAV4VWN3_CAEEX|nr:hypothetical protein CEXT_91411 [Caerostris extrusa]
MLETQLPLPMNWNGIAKDVAQGHYQMRQYLMDKVKNHQRKKLNSLGSCSLINCPKHVINNVIPKRNANHLTSNILIMMDFNILTKNNSKNL